MGAEPSKCEGRTESQCSSSTKHRRTCEFKAGKCKHVTCQAQRTKGGCLEHDACDWDTAREACGPFQPCSDLSEGSRPKTARHGKHGCGRTVLKQFGKRENAKNDDGDAASHAQLDEAGDYADDVGDAEQLAGMNHDAHVAHSAHDMHSAHEFDESRAQEPVRRSGNRGSLMIAIVVVLLVVFAFAWFACKRSSNKRCSGKRHSRKRKPRKPCSSKRHSRKHHCWGRKRDLL